MARVRKAEDSQTPTSSILAKRKRPVNPRPSRCVYREACALAGSCQSLASNVWTRKRDMACLVETRCERPEVQGYEYVEEFGEEA
jgi:hypothetical protein